MMKIAGIVVCNPNYDRLQMNIKGILPQVDKLVIYRNSVMDLEKVEKNDKIIYLNNGSNNGIGMALNAIMDYANSEGAEWCLLLDQDSVVDSHFIEKFEKYTWLDDAAILSPVIHDDKDQEEADKDNSDYSIIDMCITSGTYNNVYFWKKINRFREEFFIDYIDWEYCARARSTGYKIYRINGVTLNHQLGAKTYHNLLGKKIFTYNHNAFRKYYITRNTIVSYKLFPAEIKFQHPYLRTVKRLMLTIFFEEDKVNKIRAIIRGVRDSKKLYGMIGEKQAHGN